MFEMPRKRSKYLIMRETGYVEYPYGVIPKTRDDMVEILKEYSFSLIPQEYSNSNIADSIINGNVKEMFGLVQILLVHQNIEKDIEFGWAYQVLPLYDISGEKERNNNLEKTRAGGDWSDAVFMYRKVDV